MSAAKVSARRFLGIGTGMIMAVFLTSCGKSSPEEDAANAAAKSAWDTLLTTCGEATYYGGSSLDMVDVGGTPHPYKGLLEFKKAVFKVTAKPLSEADKLNGLEWEGQASMTASLWREREGADDWGKWSDGINSGKLEDLYGNGAMGEFGDMGQGGYMIIHMWKVKGHWAYARGNGVGGMSSMQRPVLLEQIKATKVSCDAPKSQAELDHATQMANAPNYTSKPWIIEAAEGRVFLPLDNNTCERFKKNQISQAELQDEEKYFSSIVKDDNILAVETKFVPYLTAQNNPNSVVGFNIRNGYGGFLAKILDGPHKDQCGLINRNELADQEAARNNPNADQDREKRKQAAKARADAAEARKATEAKWRFSGTAQAFRDALQKNVTDRAVQLNVDPTLYAEDIKKLDDIVATCTAVSQADYDNLTKQYRAFRLAPGYANCEAAYIKLSDQTRDRAISVETSTSRIVYEDGKMQQLRNPNFHVRAIFTIRQGVDKLPPNFGPDDMLSNFGIIDADIPVASN